MRKQLSISAVVIVVALVMGSSRIWVVAQQAGSDKADLVATNLPNEIGCLGDGPVEATGFGFVNAHRVDDELIINVHVRNGLPNTTYLVGVRCVNNDATLQTNSKGVGNATFMRPAQVLATDCGNNPNGCGYGPAGTPITSFAVSVHTGVNLDTFLADNLASQTLNP